MLMMQDSVEANLPQNDAWKEELRIVHYWVDNLRVQAPKLTHEFITSAPVLNSLGEHSRFLQPCHQRGQAVTPLRRQSNKRRKLVWPEVQLR